MDQPISSSILPDIFIYFITNLGYFLNESLILQYILGLQHDVHTVYYTTYLKYLATNKILIECCKK